MSRRWAAYLWSPGVLCSTASEGWWVTPGIPGITDSYATGPVSGEAGGNYIGGLIGSSLGTFADSYWDTGASGQSDSDGGTGQTTSDKQQAVGMMMETISNTGAVPREVSADAGYYSAKAVGDLHALGVDPFIAPEQTRHGGVVRLAPRGRIPRHLSPRDRMRRKLQTKRGRQRYALRMETVEPVFGQIKQGRGSASSCCEDWRRSTGSGR